MYHTSVFVEDCRNNKKEFKEAFTWNIAVALRNSVRKKKAFIV